MVVAGDEAPLHRVPECVRRHERRSGTGTGRTRHNPGIFPPFDKTRCGHGAGRRSWLFYPEDYEHARARGAKMYAELEGWGFTCDAH